MTFKGQQNSKKVNILGVYFDHVTMSEMVENIKTFFTTPTSHNLFIVTANPEIVDYASEHQDYQQLINSSDYVIADGTGIVKASHRLKQPLPHRIPGIELLEECLKIANANQQKVFILGSKNEIIEKAEQQLKAKYPRVTFAHHHGYINLKDETVIKRIDTFDPDYIFVGMGYPKQEKWIARHSKQFQHTVMMGVGGSFEVFSGAKKRAPKFFRKFNIEWIYRLLIDWKRLGRLKSIPKFMIKIAKQKRKH